MNPKDQPITTTALIKYLGLSCTAVTIIVSLVWFLAGMKSDLLSQQEELTSYKREAQIRMDDYKSNIDKLANRADSTDRAITDLGRKLDVVVTILDRIEKKVEKTNP